MQSFSRHQAVGLRGVVVGVPKAMRQPCFRVPFVRKLPW